MFHSEDLTAMMKKLREEGGVEKAAEEFANNGIEPPPQSFKQMMLEAALYKEPEGVEEIDPLGLGALEGGIDNLPLALPPQPLPPPPQLAQGPKTLPPQLPPGVIQ